MKPETDPRQDPRSQNPEWYRLPPSERLQRIAMWRDACNSVGSSVAQARESDRVFQFEIVRAFRELEGSSRTPEVDILVEIITALRSRISHVIDEVEHCVEMSGTGYQYEEDGPWKDIVEELKLALIGNRKED